MAKKSILYIITKSVWGGAAKYVYDLSTNLPKEDFNVYVAAGGKGEFYRKINQANIPYYEIKSFQRDISIFKEIIAAYKIFFLLLKLKPDIVHVNSSKAGGLAGLVARKYQFLTFRKIRLIFTAHGWAFNEDRPKWQIWLIKLLSKITCLFYNAIICVSEYDRQTAIKNKIAPIGKLTTIHNGIDIKSISFLSREKAQKELLNGRTSSFVIGVVAEWTKNKGILYLLKAIKEIKENNFDFVLIGSGENPDKEKIYKYIEKNNLRNIYLHEYVPNAASYLKAFDIFVLPSVKEGLPYTILEAMAAQIPIIATIVGGIPEIFSAVFSNAVFEGCPCANLIQSKNSRQLAEKIINIFNNQEFAQESARKAKQKLEQEFSLEKMLKRTKNLYY